MFGHLRRNRMYRRILTLVLLALVLLSFSCAKRNTAYEPKKELDYLGRVDVVGNPSQISAGDDYAYVALDQGGFAQIRMNDLSLDWFTRLPWDSGEVFSFRQNRLISYVPQHKRLFLYEALGTDKFFVINTERADEDSLKIWADVTGGTSNVKDIHALALNPPVGTNTMEVAYVGQTNTLRYAQYDGSELWMGSLFSVDTDYIFSGVYIDGDYIYTAAQQRGLAIFSKEDGAFISELPTAGQALKLCVHDGYAYIASRQSGLQIVDVRDVHNPVLVGSFPTTGHATTVSYYNGYVALSSGGGSAYVIDVKNPAQPKLVQRLSEAGYVNVVCFKDDILIVGSRDEGILFYKI